MNPVLGSVRRAVRWVARLRPARVHTGPAAGLRLSLGRASAGYDLGVSEMAVQEFLVGALRPAGVLYDVGANIGFFSLLGARLVGDQGRVIAFEPVPENADAVRRNAALNGFENVFVRDVAVGRACGAVDLVLTRHPGGATLASVGEPPDARGIVRVVAKSIDALMEREDFPAPSVVKIDVEGAEMEVLLGMERTARRVRPAIVCEVDAASREEAEAKARAVEDLLGSWGYAPARLPESYAGSGWSVLHVAARGQA